MDKTRTAAREEDEDTECERLSDGSAPDESDTYLVSERVVQVRRSDDFDAL